MVKGDVTSFALYGGERLRIVGRILFLVKKMLRCLLIVLALLVVTAVVFGEVRNHQFLWDDDTNVTENAYLNPVTLPKLLHFWQRPYARLYVPLTYTVWSGLALVSGPGAPQETGLKPRPFHIANLILHMLSVLMVFAILRLLVANDLASCAGAMLFALHPVQVEPVAWVTGLKDVLYGLLSLTAIWQYLLYAQSATLVDSLSREHGPASTNANKVIQPRRAACHYALASLAFMLALLAKPTAVCVPLMVWVLDRWVLGRSLRQVGVSLAGWFTAAVVFIIITRFAQPDVATKFVTPLWARPLVAGDGLAFYLYKLAFPFWLAPDYGRSPARVLGQTWIYFTWMVPVGLGVVFWLWRKRWPLLLASLGVFIVGVLPVSGLIPFDFQRVSTVADRYLYLSMLGPAMAAASVLARQRRIFVAVSFALVLGLLGVASASQTQYWRDATTLFGYTLTVNSKSPLAHNNLGNALVLRGELEAAIGHYRQALATDPAYALGHNNLGNALFARGELDEAVDHLRQALQLNPAYAKAHYNLGIALARRGELEEAIDHFRQAVQIDPAYAKAHYNLGIALARRGELEEAIDHFRQTLHLQPQFAEAHESLGRALAQQGKRDEAVKHYEEALRIMKSRREFSATR